MINIVEIFSWIHIKLNSLKNGVRITLNDFQYFCNAETISPTSSTNSMSITRIGNIMRFNLSFSGVSSSSGNISNAVVETATFKIPKVYGDSINNLPFNSISIYSPMNTGVTGGVTSLNVGSCSVSGTDAAGYTVTMKIQVTAKHGSETTGNCLFYLPLTYIS